MIVLHAGIYEHRLVLWGEVPVEGQARTRQRGGQKHAESLPYDAGAERLCAVLHEVGFALPVGKQGGQAYSIWLPSVDGWPIASSPLIAEPLQSRAQATLSPWTVTGLYLSIEQAVEILCGCVGKQILAAGVVVGSDLAFWATAMRFAGALVARQQFLPDLSSLSPGEKVK